MRLSCVQLSELLNIQQQKHPYMTKLSQPMDSVFVIEDDEEDTSRPIRPSNDIYVVEEEKSRLILRDCKKASIWCCCKKARKTNNPECIIM